MPLEVQQVESGDSQRWAGILIAAFTDKANRYPGGEYFDVVYPGHSTPEGARLIAKRLEGLHQRTPPQWHLKVVDTSAANPKEPIAILSFAENTEPLAQIPSLSPDGFEDPALYGYANFMYQAAWQQRQESYLEEVPQITLLQYFTLPEHQGRGAGTMLLKAFAEYVDAKGWPSQVYASAQARRRYESIGFVLVEEVVRPLPPGFEDRPKSSYLSMKRPARGARQ